MRRFVWAPVVAMLFGSLAYSQETKVELTGDDGGRRDIQERK